MLRRKEQGASAVFLAASIVLLVAMAAIAIDVGAGFTERRGNQSAADVAVLAGVLDLTNLGQCGAGSTDGCDQLLDLAERNLTEQYSPTEWEDLWKACTDPNKPAGFTPLRASTSNGWDGFVGTDSDGNVFVDRVDCISASSQELRVRIPDQLIETQFARVIGANELATNADAQAALLVGGKSGVIPFGVLSGASGETCLLTAPKGQAEPPCDSGPDSGNFYTLLSQTWGPPSSDLTQMDCLGTAGNNELAINVAIGLDHPITKYPDYGEWSPPADRNTYVFNDSTNSTDDQTTRKDECKPVAGEAVADDDNPDFLPRDTVIADTGGSASKAVLNGLINGRAGDFPNAAAGVTITPRLRNLSGCVDGSGVACDTRTVDETIAATSYSYQVNDEPLWAYLVANEPLTAAEFTCGAVVLNNTNDVDTTEEMDCLLDSFDASSEGIIFSDAILTNKRFGFTPQFYFNEWGSGKHPQPVERFAQVYVHKLWFKDSPSSVVFEPGDLLGPICIGGGSCAALDLIQMTAFVIPDSATSTTVTEAQPGGSSDSAEPVLTK